MVKRHFIVIGLAVMSLLLAAGISRADEIKPGATEPRELLERHAKAVTTGNTELFLSTFSTNSPAAKVTMPSVEAFFDMVVEWVKFHDKFVKAYGREALEVVGMGPSVGYKPLSKAEILARPETTPINVEGDSGTTESLFTMSEMHLVKEDGRWFINPAGRDPKASTDNNPLVRAMVVTMFKRMEQNLKTLEPLIGKTGETPETIKAAMEKIAREQKKP